MQENDYIALLARQFTGALDHEEQIRLDAWIAASAENRALAEQLRLVWQRAGAVPPVIPPLDLDADYRRVLARVRAEAAPRGRIVPMRTGWLRVAAAVVVLVAGVWGFRFWQAGQAGPLQTVLASDGAVRSLDLPDGSHVWLRPGASLQYPRHFARGVRDVTLAGDAYFEVAKRAAQPFRVQTAAGDRIEVLGTAFGVLGNSERQLAVLVRSGKVRFAPAATNQAVELTERQKAVFDRTAGKITKFTEASLNELAWQSGGLEFVGTPMHQVVADLEAYYNVTIDLQNPALRNCRHFAPLTKQPIEAVLRSLEIAYGVEVRKKGVGEYEVRGGACR